MFKFRLSPNQAKPLSHDKENSIRKRNKEGGKKKKKKKISPLALSSAS